MVIIGIDPGTVVTGYGIIALQQGRWHALDYGSIQPPRKMALSDRYLAIHEGLDHLLAIHAPEILVVETQFVHKNVQSALKLGMARGTALLTAKRRGLKIMEYSPARVKKAVVGKGHASKRQVQAMVQSLLTLNALPEPEDAADALALALCHAFAQNYQALLGVEI